MDVVNANFTQIAKVNERSVRNNRH